MEPFLVQILVMAAFGGIVSFIAKGRGRSPVGWFFIGAFAPCIGLILVLVLQDMNVVQERHKRLSRDNQRLRERVKKDRQVSDHRHEQAGKRLAAHDAVLGLDTASEEEALPPQLPGGRPVAEDAWHYSASEDAESTGPVSVATLRDLDDKGEIADGWLFWRKGMENWLPLEQIPELERLLDDE
jgi:hypothetical protein